MTLCICIKMTFFDKILANDKKNSHNQNSITTILLLNICKSLDVRTNYLQNLCCQTIPNRQYFRLCQQTIQECLTAEQWK